MFDNVRGPNLISINSCLDMKHEKVSLINAGTSS